MECSRMEKLMKRVECTEVFSSSVDKVWEKMTDNEDYAWRSDLSRITVSDGGDSFVEYTKNGIPTKFSVTLKVPHERYEFDMENENMRGHWIGILEKDNGRTKVTLIEEVELKKESFVKNLLIEKYLKKMQKQYVADLREALGE